jgi:PPM family protein phosphatase
MDRPLSERSAAVSDPGPRSLNEDAVLISALPGGGELVAVADGMGGHSAGEVASRRALEVLYAEIVAGASLENALTAANSALLEEAARSPAQHGMGTTVVALVRRDGTYTVANVGDSRAYRIDGNGVRQLTLDHSFVAEAVHSGQLSAAEALKSRWRNAVTRAVGTESELKVDCFGPFDATESHTILLCTDGLYRVIDETQLHHAVLRSEDPWPAVRKLAGAALAAGADDNVSVALIHFGAAPMGLSVAPQDPGVHPPLAATTAAAPCLDPAAGNAVQRAQEQTFIAGAEQVAERTGRRGRRRYSARSSGWTRSQLLVMLAGVIALIAFVASLRLVP